MLVNSYYKYIIIIWSTIFTIYITITNNLIMTYIFNIISDISLLYYLYKWCNVFEGRFNNNILLIIINIANSFIFNIVNLINHWMLFLI